MPVQQLPIVLTYELLQAYTDNFSDENYIDDFQFGKLYHGKIPQPGSAQPKSVTVKVWRRPKRYRYFGCENMDRLMHEVVFLQKPSHPGLMKLYGFCLKLKKSVVLSTISSAITPLTTSPPVMTSNGGKKLW